MRPRIAWMTRGDNEILDFLAGHEIDEFMQPPTAVAENIDMSKSHVQRRLQAMTDAGLLDRVGGEKGYYQLSELGWRYLANELTESEFETLEEADHRTGKQ